MEGTWLTFSGSGTIPTAIHRSSRWKILPLVIARPLKGDVKYRTIARPLVDLIEQQGLPARVFVLRPPTIDNLRAYLREHPNSVHLIHFDGHGGYGPAPIAGAPYTLAAAQGRLLFEDANGEPDPVEASTLSALLQEHRTPAVVLNACQSAMLDRQETAPAGPQWT